MKFAVIGNPIDKSLSPQLHEILYEKLNILNCSFEKIHIENDELDYSFKRAIVKEYQRNYRNGHLIGYSIEVQLLDYHEELDEWDNKLIFMDVDANWHDRLYENMKVIVYE